MHRECPIRHLRRRTKAVRDENTLHALDRPRAPQTYQSTSQSDSPKVGSCHCEDWPKSNWAWGESSSLLLCCSLFHTSRACCCWTQPSIARREMKLGPSIRAAEKQKSVREQFFVLGSQISNSEGKENNCNNSKKLCGRNWHCRPFWFHLSIEDICKGNTFI